MERARSVWIVSELYYPEETSTGFLLTKIAESLAQDCEVSVLCGQPSYSAKGLRAPANEKRNGVQIKRYGWLVLDKDNLPLRLLSAALLSLSVLWAGLKWFRPGAHVLVVTNPPILPFVVLLAAKTRGAKVSLIVHDVYPEVLVRTGLSSSSSLLVRITGMATAHLYAAMEKIVVLGRDMAELVAKKLSHARRSRVVVIPNWADLDLVTPENRGANRLLAELGLHKKLVVQYAGNMGRTHGLEIVVECAHKMNGRSRWHFLMIGSGAKRRWVSDEASKRGLGNMTLLPPRPREEQPDFLNACDVALISFVPGMAGISVPSRMYNVLAAGKPIIAVADSDSELAMVVRENMVGWVVEPGDPEKLEQLLVQIEQNPKMLQEAASRCRQVAETYSLHSATKLYRQQVLEC